ncbi:MAG: hypothetical protein IKG82_06570 [Oscillospiraceae bacterium]|nr:hypothetical protein [Oscillospiraceae bacterium]
MRSKKLLTAAAILCRSFAWFPLCILLPSLRAEDGQNRMLAGLMEEIRMTIHSDAQILLPALLICFLSFAVQMTAHTAGERFRISPRKAFAIKLTAALPAVVLSIFAVYRISGSLFNAVVLTAAAILLPLHGIDNPPEKLFAQPHYVAFLTAVILSALTLHLSDLPMHTGWLFAVTAVISALFLLLLNQFMLLRLVNRRSNAETPVPSEIRRSNLVMVIGMLLLMTAILVFRKPLTAVLIWMRDTAATAFWKLMLMIIRKQGGAAEIEEEADILPPPAEGEASPLWVLVWIPIIFVMWIVWRNLLSDWVYEIHELLRRLLAFLRGETRRNGGRKRPAESEEYYDTETTARRPLTKKQMKRRWRQQLRAWRSQPDSREKFYAGYQLLLTAPAWETGELRDADTVQEIREKWLNHHTPQDALDAVTSAYHTDRYAERGLPEQAVAELSAALDKLRR